MLPPRGEAVLDVGRPASTPADESEPGRNEAWGVEPFNTLPPHSSSAGAHCSLGLNLAGSRSSVAC